MARLLKELGPRFDGVLCLEWEKLWHPYLPPLAQALPRRNREWLVVALRGRQRLSRVSTGSIHGVNRSA